MQITSQYRLEVLFKRTPYADTFRSIQNFKTKEVRFQDIFYTFYIHILVVNGSFILEILITNI